jgi:transglutaminase-like putative cysteine protease
VIAALAFKALAIAFMIATPLLGVWVASSLAALENGPIWATVLAGLLLFPILPVGWELFARWRKTRRAARKKGAPLRPDVLTTGDRLVLRTVALNLVFLAALLAARPSAAFTALSARGDWMLDGRSDPTSEAVRARLFQIAGALEWLYLAAHDNPFREYADDDQTKPDPTATPAPTGQPSATPTATSTTSATTPAPTTTAAPDAPPAPDVATWPQPAQLHPVVTSVPPDAETSIAGLGRYIAERESNPIRRLKALHDWVADRIAYDGESYMAKRYPPQDAETVFRTRMAVCAGYSQLLSALGKAAGVEIAYVVGDARTSGMGLSGEGHAWNAARVEGRWYLVDVTWNSGHLDGTRFEKSYRTEYLMTPPRVFGLDHFPDDAKWQLVEKPLSRGEFLRQPAMAPEFYVHGLELLAPDRSQVDVRGSLVVEVKNPHGVFLLASYYARGSTQEKTRCDVENGPISRATCKFAQPGSWDVKLYTNRQQFGSFAYAGQLQANSD